MAVADITAIQLRELLAAGGVVAAGSGRIGPAYFDANRANLMVARGDVTSERFTFRNPARSAVPPAWARWSITAALGYQVGKGRGDGLCVAGYALSDTYSQLRNLLNAGTKLLREQGRQAAYAIDSNGAFDKAYARANRVGWIGRNTLVMVPGWGPAVVIGSILTDTEIDVSIGKRPGRWPCGNCTRCRDACPTGALSGDGGIVPKLCIAWIGQKESLTPEERRLLGTRVYGCDECMIACPVGSRRHAAIPTISPKEITEATPVEIVKRFGHWYIPRRDPTFVYRNALVALANRRRQDVHARRAIARFLLDGSTNLRHEALRLWLALRYRKESDS